MEKSIRGFHEQFTYEPHVAHADKLMPSARIVVAGMGGSALPAELLMMWRPELPLTIHRDYGLPDLSGVDADSTLLVAISYSGNTEEVLDALEAARAKGIAVAAIAVGGKLLERAKELEIPHVVLPRTGVQPRMATGHIVRALLAVMKETELLRQTTTLATSLDPSSYEEQGKQLAASLAGKIPVIYASAKNRAIAYLAKIKLNETGKIPAFYNVLPELNHNEMTGFDVVESTRPLSERIAFVLFEDDEDHPRVKRRMEVLAKLYADRKLPVHRVSLAGDTMFSRTFGALLVADWTAFHLAKHYGVEAEAVPMVEEFKTLID